MTKREVVELVMFACSSQTLSEEYYTFEITKGIPQVKQKPRNLPWLHSDNLKTVLEKQSTFRGISFS